MCRRHDITQREVWPQLWGNWHHWQWGIRDGVQSQGSPQRGQLGGHQAHQNTKHRGRHAHECHSGNRSPQAVRELRTPQYCQVHASLVTTLSPRLPSPHPSSRPTSTLSTEMNNVNYVSKVLNCSPINASQ